MTEGLIIEDASGRVDLAGQLLALIRSNFAYMAGRVDPPSSATRLTLETMVEKIREETVLVVRDGATLAACLFVAPRPPHLYAGKLAVAEGSRRRGLTRRLIERAEAIAREQGLAGLELQVRVELSDNFAVFSRLGFAETGRTAHAGYDRPTSITMRKMLA